MTRRWVPPKADRKTGRVLAPPGTSGPKTSTAPVAPAQQVAWDQLRPLLPAGKPGPGWAGPYWLESLLQPIWLLGRLRVIVSVATRADGRAWLHVSISCGGAAVGQELTWDEVARVRHAFFLASACVVQVHDAQDAQGYQIVDLLARVGSEPLVPPVLERSRRLRLVPEGAPSSALARAALAATPAQQGPDREGGDP